MLEGFKKDIDINDKEISKFENKEKKDLLPGFLKYENGRIITTAIIDTGVTEEFESFLEIIRKKTYSLPAFIQSATDSRKLYIKEVSETDVTDQWNEWIKTINVLSK